MPWPSSRTLTRRTPPSSISTCTDRARASSAFSTSSFTTEAGLLHHLAGGDLVDEVVREPLDRAHSHFFFRAKSTMALGTTTIRASAQT